ncbi:MAG: glutamate-1-semialdehyde 2,1-aminomutase [Nitrospira sp.]|nr:glutamate-1-semialdehyde 2,1-aminomutase [Nitrospira sp.]MBP0124391.1 glutamate-1-semialdehyde 2,1-aminomutase [Nitrospira sp.]MBP0127459.1 glutamate-1-semialdehyde 2,1-aminomutase [Nitrospira sp.]MBP0128736.1 glutamate-1-semialdehyde 2,1-aminomutase [Nitrospira sp.]MBP0130389.1 glutamate-1-semialdehyde 2,1-aminomutase [Nitrospira sp.]
MKTIKTTRSAKLFADAQQLIPGGVNSPVRAFLSVGGAPRFIKRAKGARLYDVDGNSYIDYILSWGPMILGHAAPAIIRTIKKAAANGTSYGAPTELEVTLARMINQAFPSMEKVRLVSSGTEAVMSAIRVARGFTKRDNILKFDGCYHGHGDYLLAKAGSGLATLGIPDSLGVPADFAKHTLTVPYNDIRAVQQIIKEQRNTLACIIVEPIAGNMGVVPPAQDFLRTLRRLTAENDILLIFDEVMSGFRVTYGGAQTLYGITPDLTVLGKIIGGGLPVGAYGGRKEIMNLIAPSGPVYQAGTLSGNPLAVSAGIETLKQLKVRGVYKKLEEKSAALAEGIGRAAKKAGIPLTQTRVGSMLGAFFTSGAVVDWNTAKLSDTKRYGQFFHKMLEQGIYLAPSQFEAAFLSTAHSTSDIEKTIKAAHAAFKSL